MTNEEDEINITIESLTGTIYELTISVFETILAIKARIQRLEGKLLINTCTKHPYEYVKFVS